MPYLLIGTSHIVYSPLFAFGIYVSIARDMKV